MLIGHFQMWGRASWTQQLWRGGGVSSLLVFYIKGGGIDNSNRPRQEGGGKFRQSGRGGGWQRLRGRRADMGTTCNGLAFVVAVLPLRSSTPVSAPWSPAERRSDAARGWRAPDPQSPRGHPVGSVARDPRTAAGGLGARIPLRHEFGLFHLHSLCVNPLPPLFMFRAFFSSKMLTKQHDSEPQ